MHTESLETFAIDSDSIQMCFTRHKTWYFRRSWVYDWQRVGTVLYLQLTRRIWRSLVCLFPLLYGWSKRWRTHKQERFRQIFRRLKAAHCGTKSKLVCNIFLTVPISFTSHHSLQLGTGRGSSPSTKLTLWNCDTSVPCWKSQTMPLDSYMCSLPPASTLNQSPR